MAKLKPGDKAKCIYAATSAYETGGVYDVVECPKTGKPAIVAKDCLLDLVSMVISKFEKVP